MADKSQVPPVSPVYGAAAQGEIVTIFIGPEKKRYNIHKDIICHHSEYFRTAFNGHWKESDEGVTLEDVEVEVFNVFVHWLYAQSLPVKSRDFAHIARDKGDKGEEGYNEVEHEYGLGLLKACVFGNRFLAPAFERLTHNQYIDHLAKCDSGVRYDQIIFAWDNFKEDSEILTVMVDNQCLRWEVGADDAEEQGLRAELPQDFLIRVMLRFAAFRDSMYRTYKHWIYPLEAEAFYMEEKTEEATE
ncbi:hypothetical protein J4E81_008897 [Alternaria sp. BMP 2799]|nr:hypothetical protein J4E81_008897 [Alternaria sp. BMP 2799]